MKTINFKKYKELLGNSIWGFIKEYGLVILVAFASSSSLCYTNRTKLSKHFSKGVRKEFLVLHYTASPHDAGKAGAVSDYLVRSRHAGAHVVIDDNERWQIADFDWSVPAVGGRSWSNFRAKPWLKGRIKNQNSISWEMCFGWNRDNTAILERTASDMGFVLVTLGLESGAIVRHHDAVGKYCPFFGSLYLTDLEWLTYYKNPAGSGFWDKSTEDAMFYLFKLRVEYWRLYHLNRLGKISDEDYKNRLGGVEMKRIIENGTLKPWVWPEYPIKGIEREVRKKVEDKLETENI